MLTRLALLLSLCALAYAQVDAAAKRFEVASIRLANGEPGSSGVSTGNGRMTARNVTLKRCIMGAYRVGPNQIVGGPDWLDSDRFDILAKSDEPLGDRGLMEMLQNLLAERFKLTIHHESRPISAYVLEVGKNGPRLTKSEGGISRTDNGRGNLVVKATTMDRFAEILARQMDLPVVNRTGLDGEYDLELRWTPEGAKPGADADGPSVFTAIQEQLGLRLRAQKTPIDVLVIDHAERPAEN